MRIKVLILLVISFAAISFNLLFESASARNAQSNAQRVMGVAESPSRRNSAHRNVQSNAQRVLGLLVGNQEEVVIVPEAVRVGEDFQVTVNTFGGGCETQGDEGVILSEDRAFVTVYDFTEATRPGIACTKIAKTFPHTVTLRFTKAGVGVIRIWARRIGPDTPLDGAPIVLERLVKVNPD
jgi:hypothetical protein